MSPHRTAVVFLTHSETARISRHFERLKAETRGLADAFLCVDATVSQGALPADFRVSDRDRQKFLPGRRQQCQLRGALIPGFTDLAYMPALLGDALAGHEFLWLVEYDVDYAGNWAAFFSQFADNTADFLGTTLFPRSACADWFHWTWFRAPVGEQHHFRSFVPIMRFSRRMLACYREAVETGDWEGHTEAILPAIASSNGLVIEDVGGLGPLTPASRRGRNYENVPTPKLSIGTMIHRPGRHASYFHEVPENFSPGFLHDPVKPSRGSRETRPLPISN